MAVVSCLVWREKSENRTRVSEDMEGPVAALQEAARQVAKVGSCQIALAKVTGRMNLIATKFCMAARRLHQLTSLSNLELFGIPSHPPPSGLESHATHFLRLLCFC